MQINKYKDEFLFYPLWNVTDDHKELRFMGSLPSTSESTDLQFIQIYTCSHNFHNSPFHFALAGILLCFVFLRQGFTR